MKKTIYSAMQPSGDIHIGNYLGALKNFIKLQNDIIQDKTIDGNILLGIADLHALTTGHENLKKNTLKTCAIYIATGVDIRSIYIQSSIKQHSELCWILSCIAPIGFLNRMTQFKEKSGKNKDFAGLYTYPILMAADILLFKATHVPVGEDQKQHLEFVRDIAVMFNNKFCKDHEEFFQLPSPLILGNATRVMSLRDASKKMSKSDESKGSYISLLDTNDSIVEKIRKAKTDSEVINEDLNIMKNRKKAINLINIMASFLEVNPQDICYKFAGLGFQKIKKELINILIDKIAPIRSRAQELIDNEEYLQKILSNNCENVFNLAEKNMKEIRTLVGIS